MIVTYLVNRAAEVLRRHWTVLGGAG